MLFPELSKRDEPAAQAPPTPPAVSAAEATGEPLPSPLASPDLAGEIYDRALKMLAEGVPHLEIVASLVRVGLTPAEAADTVSTLARLRTDALQAAGRRNMLIGALWCGGGLLVTVVSFNAGGGSFVLAWGAILFGAIQFFRGLSQSSG